MTLQEFIDNRKSDWTFVIPLHKTLDYQSKYVINTELEREFIGPRILTLSDYINSGTFGISIIYTLNQFRYKSVFLLCDHNWWRPLNIECYKKCLLNLCMKEYVNGHNLLVFGPEVDVPAQTNPIEFMDASQLV